MSLKQQMDYLFDPRSVAVIGASNDMMKWGFNILNILLTRGGREVYAINRNGSEVQGQQAYRSISEVPAPVDVAVITVPFQDIPAAMEECAGKGVKAAVIISGGLAETGVEGASVEQKAVEIARRGGMRFIGPNCMGNFNAYANFQTVPYMPQVKKGPLSIISQSGNTSQSIVHMATELGLGFSKYVSSGNEADLHLEDYLEYFAQDENTRIILAYVEGFREGRRFFELAREVTKTKPVVIMKAGRTEAGTRAVRSHTASLAGWDIVTDAALRQCGVIRVDEISEMVDVAQVLLGQPLPRGKRVGVLSTGGGGAVMAADAMMREGLELPALSPVTIERLDAMFSRRWSRGNPIDNGGDPFLYDSLWVLMEDENIDIAVIIGAAGTERNAVAWVAIPPTFKDAVDEWIDTTEVSEVKDLERLIELSGKYGKPAIYVNLAIPNQKKGQLYEKLESNYFVPLLTPERAAGALAHLVRYSEYRGVARG